MQSPPIDTSPVTLSYITLQRLQYIKPYTVSFFSTLIISTTTFSQSHPSLY